MLIRTNKAFFVLAELKKGIPRTKTLDFVLGMLFIVLTDYYASLRAPSLITTGISIGSCPYFSANAAFAFAMNAS